MGGNVVPFSSSVYYGLSCFGWKCCHFRSSVKNVVVFGLFVMGCQSIRTILFNFCRNKMTFRQYVLNAIRETWFLVTCCYQKVRPFQSFFTEVNFFHRQFRWTDWDGFELKWRSLRLKHGINHGGEPKNILNSLGRKNDGKMTENDWWTATFFFSGIVDQNYLLLNSSITTNNTMIL